MAREKKDIHYILSKELVDAVLIGGAGLTLLKQLVSGDYHIYKQHDNSKCCQRVGIQQLLKEFHLHWDAIAKSIEDYLKVHLEDDRRRDYVMGRIGDLKVFALKNL